MGFLNKVKNLFFEEEEVEIEDEIEEVKKEKPVAKKIELPKVVKKEEPPKEEIHEEIEVKKENKVPEKENKFPMNFDEDDFKEESFKEVREEHKELEKPKRREKKLYQNTQKVLKEEEKKPPEEEVKYDFEKEYGKEKIEESHGPYEGKATKKVFTPTPIISPIYGILDKNYKKDDVVTKKEVHLSSVTPKKVDLDTVREKAYGDLTSDISETMGKAKKDYEEEIVDFDSGEEENILFDLNDEKSQPEVKKVTVGDAEEYFNELGLEYNIDYKDTSIEKSKKETKKRRDEDEVKDDVEIIHEEEKDKQEDNEELESNLFDLIDSMYEEKE